MSITDYSGSVPIITLQVFKPPSSVSVHQGWEHLREALRVAVELDSFQQASRQRSRAVRGAKLEESPQQTPVNSEIDKNLGNLGDSA